MFNTHTMNSAKVTQQIKRTMREAKARVERFDCLISELRDKIEQERSNGLPDVVRIQLAMQTAEKKLHKIQKKIVGVRGQLESHKEVLDGRRWSQWPSPPEEAMSRWVTLCAETDWLSPEVYELRKELELLEEAELTAIGNVEAHQRMLSAVEMGVHAHYMEQDLRLVAAIAARDTAICALEEAKTELKAFEVY